MKGRLVLVVKKWWVAVLVLTLALSLTSCGKKKRTVQTALNYALAYVDGNLFSADLYVIRHSANNNEVVLVGVSGTNGDIVTCAILNSQTLAYIVVEPQTVFQVNAEIVSRRLTDAQVLNHDVFACRPYTAGDFLSGQVAADAVGTLPIPPSLQVSSFGAR